MLEYIFIFLFFFLEGELENKVQLWKQGTVARLCAFLGETQDPKTIITIFRGVSNLLEVINGNGNQDLLCSLRAILFDVVKRIMEVPIM